MKKEGPYREAPSEGEKNEMKAAQLTDRVRDLIKNSETFSELSGEDANLLDQVKIYLEATSKGKVSKSWAETVASHADKDIDVDIFNRAVSHLSDTEKRIILEKWSLEI
jgi:hypothetical protein